MTRDSTLADAGVRATVDGRSRARSHRDPASLGPVHSRVAEATPFKEVHLKKLLILIAATMVFGAVSAQAASDVKGGLGFHVAPSPFASLISFINPLAPEVSATSPTVGGRQWFNAQIGLDLGLGYTTFEAKQGTNKETWTGVSFDIGLPIVLKKFDKVNFILRPSFQYGTLEDKDETIFPTSTTKYTMTGVTGSLEAEWMMAENVSLSAAHGISYGSLHDDGTPETKFTTFGTTGSNFTQLGFTIYLW